MRSKKKIIVIGSIIITIVVIAIITIIIVNKKNNQKRKDNIESAYQGLVKNVERYNNIREDAKLIINEFYYSTIEDEYDNDIKLFDDYSKILKDIKENINVLDNNCKIGLNDKACNKYKITYEKLVNIYINDVNNFNKKLTLYNEEELSENKLEQYSSIYKEYIDYNKDNKYEEVDNNGENSQES